MLARSWPSAFLMPDTSRDLHFAGEFLGVWRNLWMGAYIEHKYQGSSLVLCQLLLYIGYCWTGGADSGSATGADYSVCSGGSRHSASCCPGVSDFAAK